MSADQDVLINCSCLFYQFGMSGSNYLEKQIFRAKVDSSSSLKLVKLKDIIW